MQPTSTLGPNQFKMGTVEIPPLTGLRFFAALLVCVAHVAPRLVASVDQPPFWYNDVTRLSAEGMTLFFILSGFVIHYNYSIIIQKNTKIGTYNFLVARFARLWPLYLVCLVFDLISNSHHYHFLSDRFLTAIIYYLTLSQSWFYCVIGKNALIYQFGAIPSVSWSVSTEWFFYLCYPLICFSLLKMEKINTKIIAIILISLVTLGIIAALTLNITNLNQIATIHFGAIADFDTHNQDSFFRWLIYFSPYLRINEFLLGCLIAAIYVQLSPIMPSKKEERIGLLALIFTIIGIILTHYFIFNPPHGYAFSWFPNLHRCFGFAPCFAVLIFCCARYQNWITRFLSRPAILFGGEISYSIYLLHPVLMGISLHYSSKINHSIVWNVACLMVTIIGVASLSYRFIEKPARKFLRKRLTLPMPTPTPLMVGI